MALMEKVSVSHDINYYVNDELYFTGKFEEELGAATLHDKVVKAGYTFDGWYDSYGDPVTSIPAGTTSDVDLYATLSPITYTVKFFADGVELTDLALTYQISETDIALPATPDKEGAANLGWVDAEGNSFAAIPAGTHTDLVLYAKYETNNYKITYVLNGGENDPANVTEYAHGNVPTLLDPLSRDGYIFEGWCTEEGGDPIEDLSAYANQDITLYAQWSEIPEGTLTPEVPF